MSELVFDFADDPAVNEKICAAIADCGTKSEVDARLEGAVILPAPGRLDWVYQTVGGLDLLFLIGEGERPRVVHCSATQFDAFA